MADVDRGDVLEITSGDYAGQFLRVRDVDSRTGYSRLTSSRWLDSQCTIKRPAEEADDVNADGQTAEGLTEVATNVACAVQTMPSSQRGEKEVGWAQVPDAARRVIFDDRTALAEVVREAALGV